MTYKLSAANYDFKSKRLQANLHYHIGGKLRFVTVNIPFELSQDLNIKNVDELINSEIKKTLLAAAEFEA